MVYKRKNSNRWWYKFVWNGELIRERTKQTNKRIAEQMEAAHKAALAKGEVGIRDRVHVPTLAEFAAKDFLPFDGFGKDFGRGAEIRTPDLLVPKSEDDENQ